MNIPMNHSNTSLRRLLQIGCAALMACFVTAGLVGCMTTETPTGGLATEATSRTTAIPAGKARLTLTRVSSLIYAAAPATVKINGEQVASLGAGSSTSIDIAPGATSVSVEAWSYPGIWTVDLAVKPGRAYELEISPRGDSVGPNLLLGALGGAIDANANKNAGAFQMRLVTGTGGGKT